MTSKFFIQTTTPSTKRLQATGDTRLYNTTFGYRSVLSLNTLPYSIYIYILLRPYCTNCTCVVVIRYTKTQISFFFPFALLFRLDSNIIRTTSLTLYYVAGDMISLRSSAKVCGCFSFSCLYKRYYLNYLNNQKRKRCSLVGLYIRSLFGNWN